MSEEIHEYLVPDYFPGFQCKIGACRHSCCEGWAISVTMPDYFKLLGLPCSAELRRRIDIALHLYDYPTQEKYAQISPRYDGNCGMRLPDGRCGLQAELGEEALSEVCRLYPRGIRTDGGYEASCANSCEAVLERLIHHAAPMEFIRIPLTLKAPPAGERKIFFETFGREWQIRHYFIRLMQTRSQTLPVRLLILRQALAEVQKAMNDKDEDGLLKILRQTPEANIKENDMDKYASDLHYGLKVAEEMLAEIRARSRSVHDYGEAALRWFGTEAEALDQYNLARSRFEALLPNWEIAFEQMLVNHIFFERFPFQDRPMDLEDEFLGFAALYTLLRFLCFGWLAEHPSEAAFIDLCAATFRFISHTSFDVYASDLLKRLGCTELRQVAGLLQL